jgi:Eco57I restriction-modification methylase/TaqI-like C-terminal specificity domain
MSAPREVVGLIDRFSEHVESYRDGHYNEAQLRRDYLDAFLRALDWDVDNSQGFAEAYREVIHEDAVRIGDHLKSPDYSCRVGGVRKFFVEAKKPSIDIKQDPGSAYQLRRYAWSAKLPLSILTNFEELSVYDCRIRPIRDDKAAVARIRYWTYKDYVEQWDEISAIFSKTAVLKGSFDKYAVTTKGKRGTAQVDDAFLDEIESWRVHLAKDLAHNNSGLSQRDLNWSVQQTIDRIIFLRIAEDRGLEPYGQLQKLNSGRSVYNRLKEIFKKADDRYNSGLFHFRVEAGRREEPDRLTPGLKIGDETLKTIFNHLYYPESPYEFSVLAADILGNVYERFLGNVIRLTAGHHVKVEQKPEVKKAGGVFYTPIYIVDYIVKNTIGKLLEGKTPQQVEHVRILDPACGSGSFLIGAYQLLMDWHREFYVNDGRERHSRGKAPKLHLGRDGRHRLTTAERKRILTNCIFGVDIDAQAVEVTKLSLLLKVLEGETQLEMFQERVLPDLGSNIRCGNSLVATNYFEDDMFGGLTKNADKINAFDWEREFATILAQGGFDAVIGNPPYISALALTKLLDPGVKDYWKANFQTAKGTYDIYVLFFERALALARTGGYVAFITPNKFLSAPYGQALRECFLTKHALDSIIDYTAVPVFDEASVYPVISVIRARTAFSTDIRVARPDGPTSVVGADQLIAAADLRQLPDNIWGPVLGGHTHLCARLYSQSLTLESLAGVQATSTAAEADEYSVFIDEGQSSANKKRLVNTGTIDRYASLWGASPLRNRGKRFNRPTLDVRKVKSNRAALYATPKIIVAKIAKVLECFLDADGSYASLNTNCVFAPKGGRSLEFLVGVLNSSLITFIYVQLFAALKMSGGYFQFQAPQLRLLPIPPIDNPRQLAIERLVATTSGLHRELLDSNTPHEREKIERQIWAVERQIDQIVFELYEMTAEEITVVESFEELRLRQAPRLDTEVVSPEEEEADADAEVDA